MPINLERVGVALDREERNKQNRNLEKIEAAIDEVGNAVPEAQAAKLLSEEAKAQAVAAENKSKDVQRQLDEIVVEGDSSVEAAQARVTENPAESFATLQERLNSRDRQLADKAEITKLKETAIVNGFRSNSNLNNLSSGGRKKLISSLNGAYGSTNNGIVVNQVGADEMKLTLVNAGLSRVIFNATHEYGAIDNCKYVDLIMSCSDWSAVTNIALYIIPDKANANANYGVAYLPTKGRKNDKPHLLRQLSASYASGTLSKPMNVGLNSQFSLQITTTKPVEVTLHNGIIEYSPPKIVLIQFDDNNRSAYYYAAEAMKKRGIPGTWYVNSDTIGEGSLTWEMLHDLQEHGWTIGNHTDKHVDLRTAPLAEALGSVENGAYALSKQGFFGSEMLATPFNSISEERATLYKHTVKSTRVDMYNKVTGNPVYGTPATPPTGKINYLHGHSVQNTDTAQSIIDNYYKAATIRGLIATLVFHQVTPTLNPTATYSWNNLVFEQLLDMLIADGAIFSTAEEVYNAFQSPNAEIYGNQR